MTYLAFTGLINAITSLTLGLFVYFRNPKPSLNKAYLNLNLSIAIYSIGYFFWQISKIEIGQIFWFKILVIGIILINPAFLHFAFTLTDRLNKRKALLIACYLVNLLFIYFNLSSLLYTDFILKYNHGLWPVPSFLFNLYLIFWFWQIFYGFTYFLIGFKENIGLKREQIRYCIIAGAIGFIGGATNWPMWYNINLPPYLNILIAVHVAVVAYAILRHQLMDIEVVIKKTLVYAGLFTFAFGVIVGVAMITQELLSQFLAINRFVSLAISAVIIIFSLRPLENFLINATNKYLFQKKYDPRKILKDFSDEALTILNLDKLCKVTVDTLANNLYLTNCAVLLLGYEEVGYEIYDSFGIDRKGLYLNTESAIVKSLENNKLPLLYESYDKSLQAQDDVKKDMDKMKSQACLPLIIRNELVGILSLGAKKSDQAYNADDIDILTTLTKALSIAISNARLFMQAAQNEKLAIIGTITSAINHEVCGPLSRISAQIQLYIEDKKRNVFENEASKREFNEAEKIMQNIMQEIKKTVNITSKLSGFAKPSKVVESKPINIAQSVEDALILLKHKLELDKIKIEKNIPENLPKIIADEDQIQQIFFNLIRNAAEAIKENGTITITAKEDNNKVKVEIQDTGCGIPEDKLDEVFKPFYTTKGEVKGSGYGLAVVKELVQRNNGNITVKSKAGEGTSFYLEFLKA